MRTTKGCLILRGKTYHAVWYFKGKRFAVSTKTENLKEANEKLKDLVSPFKAATDTAVQEALVGRMNGRKAEADRLLDEHNPGLPIVAAWEAFLNAPVDSRRNRKTGNRPDTGAATLKRYREQWDRFADWMKAHHPDKPTLRDVSPELAAKYAAELSRNVGPATYNKHAALLSLVFRVLAGNKATRLTVNPFADVGRRQATPNSRRELTVEELRRVCAAATGELRTLFAIGTYTGLRLGDAATLRWQEVDLTRGAIIRVPHKTARKNPNPVTIPVHPALASMLAETPDKRRRGYVLPDTAAQYQKDCSALSNRIQAHFEANGVQTTREGTGFVTVVEKGEEKRKHSGTRAVVEVGFHSLRHTFVSLCRMADAPLAVVEAIVGHSSPAMTRHYTHTGEAAARLAIGALPGLTDDAKALPAPVNDADAIRAKVRELAENLTAKNMKATRAALLAL